jgi:2-oxoglutarate dehydrogenase E1 component
MNDSGHSHLFSGNASFIEGLYEAYLEDRSSVGQKWQDYFDRITASEPGAPPDVPHAPIHRQFKEAVRSPTEAGLSGAAQRDRLDFETKQVAVLQLINAYRFRGHRQADLDPLDQSERPPVPDLNPEFHGLTSADMETVFNTGSLFGPDQASLRDILNILSVTYCGTIGSEYMYLTETDQKRWVQERLELARGAPGYEADRKRLILERLIAANALEEYLHNKYVGQKRFSLEGGESLIPLLDALISRSGAERGVKEIVIGMAHRGRLNVQVNTLGLKPRDLFEEFEGKVDPGNGSGDVKYHKGFSADLSTAGGPLHLVLAFNPSHLEIINPVVEGSVRARQERRGDYARDQVLPVLIHGDAAFAGQGVVMETLNLSETRGYTTGGTVHIIINNQIGFTTSDPLDSRSTLYCTDVAKMVQAPIFHVNADDPEAVVYITELALDFRMRFNKDVVIDMVCYRRYGHSEADEPSATQPIMYQRIRNHPRVTEIYAHQLQQEGIISADDPAAMRKAYHDKLDANQVVSGPHAAKADSAYLVDYRPYLNTHWSAPAETAISPRRVQSLALKMTQAPEDFKLHRAVAKLLAARRKMGAGEQAMDWGFAETLAYASLLEEGYSVRLSGQDTARGTFFHRHAVIHDQDSRRTYIPLQHLHKHQPLFLPINSLLSEEAVLGFEYGYSSADPDALTIWEAQYGDFANGAQVIIDQFISAAEAKWRRLSGIVLFLPHGYDGQGPEHSSARLERYLQLCAEDNIQVCVPSTPAQMFHMLRRQILRPYRKPLIVMSPKSLLRHKLSTSQLADVTDSGWQNVIDEIDDLEPQKVRRLLFCSGKVYFDLLEARREHELRDTAIIRIEQQYPFPLEEVIAVLERYPAARNVVWVQEEPRNQGAWYYMQSHRHLNACLSSKHTLEYAGRPYSASPAVGYLHLHLAQQRQLISDALELEAALQRPQLSSA